jgi:hypothetical protein
MNKIMEIPFVSTQKNRKIICWVFITILLLPSLECKNAYTAANDFGADSSNAYIIQLSIDKPPLLPKNYNELLRYHFYGITWNGKVDDNLKFARQMGYSYVMYQNGMEKSSLASDLFFYLESPDYQVYYSLGIDRMVSKDKLYTDSQINTYQRYFALKNNHASFPDNMATGWFRSGSFCVEPDWQQQKVIDFFVDKVINYAHGMERSEKKFLFGGLAWDVPQFTGDFWGGGNQVSLAFWNGKDSSALFDSNTHEYRTYSEGKAAYYLKIKQTLMAEYPDRKLTYIFEPYNFYDSWFKGLEKLENNDQAKLMQDSFISEESGSTKWATGTEFVDDPRVYNAGLITKDKVGSSTPDNHDLKNNMTIASKAAISGAWFNWYGRFSGSGDNVPMRNIYEVPSWLQLIRVVANWDNLNGIPLEKRNYNGSVYTSTSSRIDQNVIYSRQPKTQKLFVVFLNKTGEIILNPGEKIVSVKRVDSYFCETHEASSELTVKGNKIRLKN